MFQYYSGSTFTNILRNSRYIQCSFLPGQNFLELKIKFLCPVIFKSFNSEFFIIKDNQARYYDMLSCSNFKNPNENELS